ncbi:MAG TPA: MarR family winged helix-turn-helix transcriptional regulator [Ramlibacter sp.]|nr:MarR family winged helix-turn-helix transcriptional regulator [Ramlibacter sp.]
MPVARKKSRPRPKSLPLTTSNPALLVDGTDQTLRRLTLAFAVLGWQLAEIRNDFGKLVHVSPFQYVMLQAIARVETDEPWTARSLARHFRVTNAFVSMELRSLLEKELVQAEPNADDRRSKLLSLTPQGAQALTTLAPVQQKVNDILYSQFDSAGLTRQCEQIERMAADAEKAIDYLREVLATRTFGN